LAASTAELVSVASTKEMTAQTSSFEGFIISKSFDFDGDIHLPFMQKFLLSNMLNYYHMIR